MRAMRCKCRVLKASFLCLFLLLCSCGDKESRRSYTYIPEKTQLSSPVAISVGRYLYWGEVQDATEYSVFQNGELVSQTTERFCVLEDSSQDEIYTIVAQGDLYEDSEPVNVTVWKSEGFSDEEMLDLSSVDNFHGTISKEIRLVKLGADKTIDLEAVVEARISDLYLQMDSVEVHGSISLEDESHSYAKNPHSLVLDCIGECSWVAKDGKSGIDYASDHAYDDEQLNGVPGEDGKDAIRYSSVVLRSDSSLLLQGGNGGNGGSGSSTKAQYIDVPFVPDSPYPGKGSNGGNGGCGLNTDFLRIQISKMDSFLTLRDGKGGKKGLPGNNNNYGTGIWASLNRDNYDIGKPGKAGQSNLGTILGNRGQIRYE